ncbi:hypothetical protein ACVGWD_00490, partial [Enterobacter asburiae]
MFVFLGCEGKTSEFVVYLEHVGVGGGFGGGARSPAPNKPILVIKSGRSPAAQR